MADQVENLGDELDALSRQMVEAGARWGVEWEVTRYKVGGEFRTVRGRNGLLGLSRVKTGVREEVEEIEFAGHINLGLIDVGHKRLAEEAGLLAALSPVELSVIEAAIRGDLTQPREPIAENWEYNLQQWWRVTDRADAPPDEPDATALEWARARGYPRT